MNGVRECVVWLAAVVVASVLMAAALAIGVPSVLGMRLTRTLADEARRWGWR